eukprot:3907569-Rhodomonas_salina.1
MMQELKSQKPDSALAQYDPNAAILTNGRHLDAQESSAVRQHNPALLWSQPSSACFKRQCGHRLTTVGVYWQAVSCCLSGMEKR